MMCEVRQVPVLGQPPASAMEDNGRMDIYVTGPRAFVLLRESRTGGTARLESVSSTSMGTGTGPLSLAERLSAIAPRTFADISERRPLDLVYPTKGERRRSRCIRPHYVRHPIPGSACRLAIPTGDLRTAGLPDDLQVFMDSPAQAFLNAAESLTRLLSAGKTDRTSAILRLISLGSELCGTYSRDPERPREADVAYKIAPACSAEEIAAHLHRHGRAKGITLAREAAVHLVDGLASPLECEFYYALTLKPRMGGASFPKPLVNKPLVETTMPHGTEPSPRAPTANGAFEFSHNSKITPDLQWPLTTLGIAVEVDGFVYHSDRQAFNTDRLRDQDCTQRGYQVLHITHDNMSTVENLEKVLNLLIDKAAARLPRSRVINLRRNVANPETTRQRETLISILG